MSFQLSVNNNVKRLLFLIAVAIPLICQGQKAERKLSSTEQPVFEFGINAGIGWTYEDKAHLLNTTVCFTLDFRIINSYSIQLAPQYAWLWTWNEHYLTIPIHLRKRFGDKLSLFAGPAISFDLAYFKDCGISAGAYYHFNKHNGLAISANTFTLYDYGIDYLYVPISLTYRFSL
jgi:hypothetical protein